MSEIDNLCNRIIAIKNGKIVEDSTIDKFYSVNEEKLSLEQAFIKKVGENKID